MINQLMPSATKVVLVLGSVLILGLAAHSAHAQELKARKEADIKAQGAVRVDGPRLKQEISGNTLYWMALTPSGTTDSGSSMRYYRDARTVVTRFRGNYPEALWWIDGDQYCGEQRSINPGNRCYSVYSFQSIYYLCGQPAAGECNFAVRIAPGNFEKFP
jgi:hypothetical protein